MKPGKDPFESGIFKSGWKNIAFCIMLAAACYFTSKIYGLLNHGPAVLLLKTPLDQMIPVVKVFVIPYISLEAVFYLSMAVFLIFKTKIFQSAALTYLSVAFVSYIFYYFLQSYVARPVITGNDPFSALIRGVYSGDNPFNCFPSLHTSISTLAAIHWVRLNLRAGIAAAVWASLIIASTVLIHQHYLADLGGGLLIGTGFSLLYIKALKA